jgi:hypothetical protein
MDCPLSVEYRSTIDMYSLFLCQKTSYGCMSMTDCQGVQSLLEVSCLNNWWRLGHATGSLCSLSLSLADLGIFTPHPPSREVVTSLINNVCQPGQATSPSWQSRWPERCRMGMSWASLSFYALDKLQHQGPCLFEQRFCYNVLTMLEHVWFCYIVLLC